ncbi:hypothetical protein ACFYKT_14725 [Cytobacillus sp. FJAT-53684]|uniref:DUF5067 domain-containing protein n=1 Tax=Cytobacillus mangrovibacter TaxID=3299024 RepID=A0ABW6K0C6_9BACI
MKRILIICISLVIVLFAAGYLCLKFLPPFTAIQSASAMENQIVLVDVGNNYPFGDIQIQDVMVNNNSKPSKAKVQVSNHSKGFIISDNFDGEEAREYSFKDLDEVMLKPKTNPKEQLKEVNEGKADKAAIIYAITLSHEEPVHKVIIKYRYLFYEGEMELSID